MTLRSSLPVLAACLLPTISPAAEPPPLQDVWGQPAWRMATPEMELAVTETGGMMAPVLFYRNTERPVQPYYISPWQKEKRKVSPPVLTALRGDFFCLPFGDNATPFRNEQHPPHGEIVGGKWQAVLQNESGPVHDLRLLFETKARAGRVVKDIWLIEGQNVVYTRDVIEGFAGPTPLGHHATLAMPEKEGVFRISTSPMRYGMVKPGLFSLPERGEYQSLMPGVEITDLAKVPLIFKTAQDADLTSLPARKGFADLLQLCNEKSLIGWVTATRLDEGWLWFSLKNPDVLNSTVMWIENHGRHGAPWLGRNNCLGLEDVCAFFSNGLADSSAPNVISQQGIPTAIPLQGQPVMINYIQGVVRVPAGFDGVEHIDFSPGAATFVSGRGVRVTVPVYHEFLRTGLLPGAPGAEAK